jgi:hypothetical protein
MYEYGKKRLAPMMNDFIGSNGGDGTESSKGWSEMISHCSCIWKQMASARRVIQTVAAWIGLKGGRPHLMP